MITGLCACHAPVPGFAGHKLHRAAFRCAARRSTLVRAMASKNKSGGRPSLQDVENISRGDAAKRRGTGSRQVPHRLNADERKLYELAKQKASQLGVRPQRQTRRCC